MSLFIMGVCMPSDTSTQLPCLPCHVLKWQQPALLTCTTYVYCICDTAVLPCVFFVICKETTLTQRFVSVVFDLLCFLLQFEYTCNKVEAHVKLV